MQTVIKRVDQAIAEHLCTACAVAIFDQYKAEQYYFGYHSQDKIHRTSQESIFDLASLTKVLATGSFLAELIEKKIIRPDQKFNFDNKEQFYYLQDLMTHQAGFVAWLNFKVLCSGDVSLLKKVVAELRPEFEAGKKSIYSDVGFVVMMHLLEQSLGQSWQKLIQNFLCSQPDFSNLFFAQSNDKVEKTTLNFVATENYSHRPSLGYVNDENCYFMGGISSHAGLFGTLPACIKAGQAWLKAIKGNSDWLSEETAKMMTSPITAQDGTVRAMCWDKPSNQGHGSTAGKYISSQGFGHLGYTGTSIWIDPEKNQGVIILANRVHPKDDHVDEFRQFRKDMHNMIWA
ncbi:MAG TPA: serine hydrolase [Oligoflexia bacterium]|nr:serine hydrolase [Oligoflexia bacterium]HMR25533.1 serine hydrolase [Oligoflexia bacterium]